MNKLKVILLNPDTNESVCVTPRFVQMNIETNPRHIETVMDFHGMPHSEFKKLATMLANSF